MAISTHFPLNFRIRNQWHLCQFRSRVFIFSSYHSSTPPSTPSLAMTTSSASSRKVFASAAGTTTTTPTYYTHISVIYNCFNWFFSFDAFLQSLSKIAINRLQKELREWQVNPPNGLKQKINDNLQRYLPFLPLLLSSFNFCKKNLVQWNWDKNTRFFWAIYFKVGDWS